jgi:hypothetical protein
MAERRNVTISFTESFLNWVFKKICPSVKPLMLHHIRIDRLTETPRYINSTWGSRFYFLTKAVSQLCFAANTNARTLVIVGELFKMSGARNYYSACVARYLERIKSVFHIKSLNVLRYVIQVYEMVYQIYSTCYPVYVHLQLYFLIIYAILLF